MALSDAADKLPQFFETGDVARTVELGTAAVRYHVRLGHLVPAAITIRGVNLFTAASIEELRRHLKARKRASR